MSIIQIDVQGTALWLHIGLGRPSLLDHSCLLFIQHRKGLILPFSTVNVLVARFNLGNTTLERIQVIVIGRVVQVLIL